ncbi:hypothetical protein [Falsirhodobacter sp. 1013]|uniref:hypothetical protein n=1 Tax=Falsirhodobacter sp. 1013 TaxID=3417566 RepID=UPI003EB73F2F
MADKIDNGGKAFPALCSDHSCDPGGMSLRDWFAGQALSGIAGCADDLGVNTWKPDQAALIAYSMADAMIAARKGGAA